MNRGEPPLLFGLVLLVIAAGLFPSAILGLLGIVYVAPVAFLLLAIGVVRSRGAGGLRTRRIPGMLLFGGGLIALAYASPAGSAFAYRMAVPEAPIPLTWTTPWILFRWLLPLPFLWFGLRLWTDWSYARRRCWLVVFSAAPLAAGILHRTLVHLGVLALSA